MSILASFMVPHPPLIIPKVGRGGEKQIEKTISAYQEVARQIAKINPETIIISSPHAPFYSDYFYISSSKNATGDLSNFGAKDIAFDEEIDEELVLEIEKIATKNNFPAGRTIKKEKIDHGTIVPLYFIRKYLPKCKIIIVGLSTLPLIDNYKFGKIIKEAVNNLNKNAVFVASGDLSHKLKSYGPYGFAKEGPEYDKKIMSLCENANFYELLSFKESFLEKASECGHRSFLIMAGFLDSLNIKASKYSYEDVTGVGYGICSFYPNGENKERNFEEKYLQEQKLIIKKQIEDSDTYVELARLTIEEYINNNKILKIPTNIEEELLTNKAGVFVSIHKFDTLRGCIGTILPTKKSIAEEIISNAISASAKDPRFTPITKDELKYLEINVDILSPPETIDSLTMLNPKKYGVIVSSGLKRGVLLPNLDGIDTIEEQLKIAKRKANITKDEKITIQRFEVIRHK